MQKIRCELRLDRQVQGCVASHMNASQQTGALDWQPKLRKQVAMDDVERRQGHGVLEDQGSRRQKKQSDTVPTLCLYPKALLALCVDDKPPLARFHPVLHRNSDVYVSPATGA